MSARRRMSHRTPQRAPMSSIPHAQPGHDMPNGAAAGGPPLPATPPRISRLARLSLATSLLLAGGLATAQTEPAPADNQRYQPLLTTPVDRGLVLTVIDGQYAANARVGQIKVEVRGAGAPADGVSPVAITVKVFDREGAPLLEPVLVTIEHTGSVRVLLPGSDTDEIGPSHKDADRQVPGTQLRVVDGQASFSLIAPNQPEDVTLRLTAGSAEVSGNIDGSRSNVGVTPPSSSKSSEVPPTDAATTTTPPLARTPPWSSCAARSRPTPRPAPSR